MGLGSIIVDIGTGVAEDALELVPPVEGVSTLQAQAKILGYPINVFSQKTSVIL
jgi:hypothetical protein